MPAIKTPFDANIEQDVILEQIDNKPPAIETTLKNAENTYKAFLYLRKMYSMYPQKEQILKMGIISNSDYEEVSKPDNGNYVFVSNLSDDISYIKINGDEFAIAPNKDFTFPLIPKTDDNDGDKLEFKGKLSYYIKIKQDY